MFNSWQRKHRANPEDELKKEVKGSVDEMGLFHGRTVGTDPNHRVLCHLGEGIVL